MIFSILFPTASLKSASFSFLIINTTFSNPARFASKIEKRDGGIAFSEDDGETWTTIDGDTLVSMNMWGFTRSILDEIKAGFPAFLEKGIKENPMKCEYFLPSVVSDLLAEGRATVRVLESEDKWYGVTYKEDKPVVVAAVQALKDEGLYPQKLWD